MDRRKIRSKPGASGLRFLSTGGPGVDPNVSQISSRSDSFGNFRPVITSSASSKRKKSPSSEMGSDNEELALIKRNLTSKKRRNDPGAEPAEQESLAQEHHEETNRAPSRMSDWGGSQASTKSRESNTSKLRRLASRQIEAQSNLKPSRYNKFIKLYILSFILKFIY